MNELLLQERLLTLGEATQHPLLTGGRNGGVVSPVTMWRWTRTGVCGVVLETVAVDGKGMLRTSVEALERFIKRVKARCPDKRCRIPRGRPGVKVTKVAG